jgi:hypothetical protein
MMWLTPSGAAIGNNDRYTGADGTSYPANFPKSEIAELVPVTLTDRPETTRFQDAGYVIENAVQIWSVTDWPRERIYAEIASKIEEVRTERNSRLASEIDNINPIRWGAMTAAKKDEWRAYRQALLDVPQQADPFDIVWPTKPQG